MTDGIKSPSDSTIITQLTAYLDGELETDEVRDVEERISSDNRYQKLLHQLQQTWDVLDILPSAEISAARDFTQSTMKLAVQDAKQHGKKKRSFWIWPLRILVLLLIPCTAATGTYVASRYFQNIPVRQFEQNVSVIRDFDAYAYDKNLNVEFLEKLDEQGRLFKVAVEPSEHMEEETKLTNSQFLKQLNDFTEVQRRRIRDNFNGFRNLSAQESSRIKSLHDQIANHVRGDQLSATLRRYYQFLQTLGETETASILDATELNEKIDLILKISAARYEEVFGREGSTALPETDRTTIYLNLLYIISNEQKQSMMDAEFLGSEADDAYFKYEWIKICADRFEGNSDDKTIYKNGRMLKLFYEIAPDKIDELITTEDVEMIRRFLSDDALTTIDETINWEGNVDKSEAQLLVQWMIEEFESRFSTPGAPETIEQVYDNLTPQERDKIDNEHPADRKRLLEQKLKEMRDL